MSINSNQSAEAGHRLVYTQADGAQVGSLARSLGFKQAIATVYQAEREGAL